VTSVCDGWQTSSIQGGYKLKSFLDRSWTKVHEVSENCKRPVVLSNTILRLSVACFFPTTFVIKFRSRRKTTKGYSFSPHFFREAWLQSFTAACQSNLPPTVCRSLVEFRVLTCMCEAWQLKQNAEFTTGGKTTVIFFRRLWTKVYKTWDSVKYPCSFQPRIPTACVLFRSEDTDC